MSNSIINVPVDTLVAGLRQRRNELAEQLARLDRTRQTVEADLEALEQAMQVVGGGQRNRMTASLSVTTPTPQTSPVAPAPVRGDAGGRRRGDLPAAVRRLLAENGPLTTAEIRDRLPATNDKQVALCLGSLAHNHMVSGSAVAGARRKRSWSLTDKGHRAVAASRED